MNKKQIQEIADEIVVDYLNEGPEFIAVVESVDDYADSDDVEEGDYDAVYAAVNAALDTVLQRWLDSDN